MIEDEVMPRSLIPVARKNSGMERYKSPRGGQIAPYQPPHDLLVFDYRMPESHSHWTVVIWPAKTSTSNGP